MRKKLIRIICMAIFVLLAAAAVAAAEPDFTSPAYGSANQLALWGSCGQCVWYAWGRAYEVTGKSVPLVSGRSSAKYWIDNARNGGFPTGPVPAKDSVAVWGGAEYDYGHVAYVEDVKDGIITISESNYTWDNPPYPCYDVEVGAQYYNGTKDLTMDSFINRYPYGFLGFIYLDEVPETPAAVNERGLDGTYYSGEQVHVTLTGEVYSGCTFYIYHTPADGDTYLYGEYELDTGDFTFTVTEPGSYSCGFLIDCFSFTYWSSWTWWFVETAYPECSHEWEDWKVTVPPGCDDDGEMTRKCSLCGEKETVTIPGGHIWGEPEYVWAGDNSEVTAKRTCKRDGSHTETETVQVLMSVIKLPGASETGLIRYTSDAFTHPAFEIQKKDVTLPALGYVPGDIDGNGSLDMQDVISFLQHTIFPELYPLTYEGDTDFNGDGAVNMNDVVSLLQYTVFPQLYPIKVI